MSDSFRQLSFRGLSPMAANPVAVTMTIPIASNPHRAMPGTRRPSARQPNPSHAIPVPISRGPDIIRARGGHVHISLWSRGRSRRGDDRFGSRLADCHRYRRRRCRHISRPSHHASTSKQSCESRQGRYCINLLHNFSPFHPPIRGQRGYLARKGDKAGKPKCGGSD